MKNIFFMIVILFSFQKISAQSSPVVRAVYSNPGTSYRQHDSNWCNSEPAFNLYKKLGYNTFIEYIPAPSPEHWIKPAFVVESSVRAELVKSIAEQKERLGRIGLDYCPFYGEWGWGDKIGLIDERGRAMVYREVPIFRNYYERDMYPRLRKTSDQWGDSSITTVWSENFNSCVFKYNGPANGCARILLQTRNMEKQFKSSLPSHLITGQCYDVLFKVNLSNAKLVIGDYLKVYCFRQYAKGEKPVSSKVPLGDLEDSHTDSKEVYSKSYLVTTVLQDGYILNNSIKVKPDATIQERMWIEPHTVCGNGPYRYDSLVRFDIELRTTNKSENATVTVNLQIKPVNPVLIVKNRQWERSIYYRQFLNTYPNEKFRETRADFDSNGTIVRRRLFLDSISPNMTCRKIYGHFLPWNSDFGLSSMIQNPIDPLSPVADLVNLEMLRIIRDGVDSVAPSLFCISSDEIPVFRRDYLNLKSGNAGTVYNKASNGEYFGRIILDQVNRYKRVFGNNSGSTYVVCGDMVLPFGIGYKYIADKVDDQNALSYLGKSKGDDQISIAFWLYDYSAIPECLNCPKKFSLKDAPFVNININKLKKHNLNYIAWYATDGRQSDLQLIDNSISDDTKHIQHEINMARLWCDITNKNTDGFSGYMFCGWAPELKTNRWNGLYPLAWFGWKNPVAQDFPSTWKYTSSVNRGDNHQPVLEILHKGIVPW